MGQTCKIPTFVNLVPAGRRRELLSAGAGTLLQPARGEAIPFFIWRAICADFFTDGLFA
jgi:hypothetical protein